MSFFSQKMSSEQLAWLLPQWSIPPLPGRGGVLSGHRGVDYTCASLGVLELDSLSLHFVVCGSSFHVKKEQSHSLSERVHIIIRVKGTPMYCQETGRERVGLGPLVEGLSIMRER